MTDGGHARASDTDLEARIRAIVAEASRRDLDSIGPNDDLVEQLGLDSLGALHILAALEKKLGVRFPDERLSELRTLRSLEEAVAGLLGRWEPGAGGRP
jgi:acyl carrier protein